MHAPRAIFGLAASFASLLTMTALASAQTPVKLGVIGDLSGIYTDVGGSGSVDAARMAIEDFAKLPGADNFAVGMVSADAQNKPDTAQIIARKWYEAEGVDMIVDLPTSAISLAVAPLAQVNNKVALFTAAASSDLYGKACTPNTIHWTYDTYSLSHGTVGAITQGLGKSSWYFITADFALGGALERDSLPVIEANGGKVVGRVKHPTDSHDFASYLLQAQASKAEFIALANAGGDTIKAIKQASEFGITQGGQKLVGMLLAITDIHALTLPVAQGLLFTTGFYWDFNDSTRAFGERFAARNGGRYPSMNQAGVYSATLAYLKAVAKVGSPKDGAAVVAAIRDLGEFADPLFGNSILRKDGRLVHDMLLVEVKTPSESTKPYDYYKVRTVIPGSKAFRSMADGDCALAK